MSLPRTYRLLFLLLSVGNIATGCASKMHDKEAGQPCTRTKQCAEELLCSGGICTAAHDAGGAGGAGGKGGAPASEEDAGGE